MLWRKRRSLYVGATLAPSRRLSAHSRKSPWFSLTQKTTIERYTSRKAALDAEAHAIKHERPLHNTVKTPRERELRVKGGTFSNARKQARADLSEIGEKPSFNSEPRR
jgi:predicted GIY-YIG superfamily endonuclease